MSNSRPKLIRRIQYGVDKVVMSGELEALFLQRFGEFTSSIIPEKSTVYALYNPQFSDLENKEYIGRTLRYFFTSTTRVFNL